MSEIDSNLDNEEFGKDTYILLRQQNYLGAGFGNVVTDKTAIYKKQAERN